MSRERATVAFLARPAVVSVRDIIAVLERGTTTVVPRGAKSFSALKLYLASYRNHPGFHEQTSVDIAERLVDAMDPEWLRIAGYWYPRGGIPIDVFFQTGIPPTELWVPDPGVATYRGRG